MTPSYAASDWPEAGNLAGDFCLACQSHFCPHAAPGLYQERKDQPRVPPTPWTGELSLEFTPIPDEAMRKIVQVGEERWARNRNFSTHKQWHRGNPFLAGLVGEWHYGQLVGQEPDWETREGGDGGTDFDGVNVKCVPYPKNPLLMVSSDHLAKDRARGRCRHYALVAWDQPAQTTAYVGWTTLEDLAQAPVRNFGYGDDSAAHTRSWRELKGGLPA